MSHSEFKVAIYADGANEADMLKRAREGLVKGFTTNPSIMAKAKISGYEKFALSVLKEIKTHPISFEVFSDEFSEMEREAKIINSWGANVNVKIPITNTRGDSSLPLIRDLLDQGMKLNVTALFTDQQVQDLKEALKPHDDVLVSIFAGRIADTGVDPLPLMKRAVRDFSLLPGSKILWASPREVFNVYQADELGCHVITCTDDIISKLKLRGKSLSEYSLETIQGFYKDAQTAGYKL